jgi:hypothetical protein
MKLLKAIAGDFIYLGRWLWAYLYLKRKSIEMRLAIALADIKQKAWNKQYHVLLKKDIDGKERLVSVCEYDIKVLARRKWLPKNTSTFDLKHSGSIFYSTALSLNNKVPKEERIKAIANYRAYAKRQTAL